MCASTATRESCCVAETRSMAGGLVSCARGWSCGERLLAAREQVDAGELLPGRLRHDLDARLLTRRLWIDDELKLGTAAAEEAREHLLELVVDERERLAEALLRRAIDAGDRGAQ